MRQHPNLATPVSTGLGQVAPLKKARPIWLNIAARALMVSLAVGAGVSVWAQAPAQASRLALIGDPAPGLGGGFDSTFGYIWPPDFDTNARKPLI